VKNLNRTKVLQGTLSSGRDKPNLVTLVLRHDYFWVQGLQIWFVVVVPPS